jgi:hypothetical protein
VAAGLLVLLSLDLLCWSHRLHQSILQLDSALSSIPLIRDRAHGQRDRATLTRNKKTITSNLRRRVLCGFQ